MDTRRDLVSESQLGAAVVSPNLYMPEPHSGRQIWSSYSKVEWKHAGASFRKMNLEYRVFRNKVFLNGHGPSGRPMLYLLSLRIHDDLYHFLELS